jgi:hypothetical protein
MDYSINIISFLFTFIGFISSIIALRIKNQILENNKKMETEFNAKFEKIIKDISDSCNKLVSIERELFEIRSSTPDKILSVVNGKYVRSDLHAQAMLNIQDKISTIKQVIEDNVRKIEDSIDRQIDDLKFRLKG